MYSTQGPYQLYSFEDFFRQGEMIFFYASLPSHININGVVFHNYSKKYVMSFLLPILNYKRYDFS